MLSATIAAVAAMKNTRNPAFSSEVKARRLTGIEFGGWMSEFNCVGRVKGDNVLGIVAEDGISALP